MALRSVSGRSRLNTAHCRRPITLTISDNEGGRSRDPVAAGNRLTIPSATLPIRNFQRLRGERRGNEFRGRYSPSPSEASSRSVQHSYVRPHVVSFEGYKKYLQGFSVPAPGKSRSGSDDSHPMWPNTKPHDLHRSYERTRNESILFGRRITGRSKL